MQSVSERADKMEFNEKLQELRKKKGMTQDELAQQLYVSRAAISKWESGRGYPNIDSLKELAKFFSVSVDELLSGDEVLTIAEEDQKQKESSMRNLVFGLLDCSVAMFWVLPFFGQQREGSITEVSLLDLTCVAAWLKAAYMAATIGIILCGVLTLALQSSQDKRWQQHKMKLSMILHMAATFLFIISRQPYAAGFLFIFLMMKALLLMKWP